VKKTKPRATSKQPVAKTKAKAAANQKRAARAKAKPVKKAKPALKQKSAAKVKPVKKAKAAPNKAAPNKAAKPAGPRKAAKSAGPRKASKSARLTRAAPKPAGSPRQDRAASDTRWLQFVERHGVVLASARGPVPSLASEVAGEPIIGSWWSHPKAQVIFETLSAIDDDVDVRCFKLVDGKVTFVHRRVWPALVRLAREGMLAPDRVASFQQEHLPTGEHRNLVTPFPEWVPDEVAAAADTMTVEQARIALGAAV